MISIDLSPEERDLLRQGLLEWGGPARCSEEMAIAIGFRSVAELLEESVKIADILLTATSMRELDWRRVLLATEIVFVSNVVGSGIDWVNTTGMSDEETIAILRSVQRKISYA